MPRRPLDSYGRRTLALGRSVAHQQRVYLDTRFWIFLRDASIGRPVAPEHDTLLRLLIAEVDAGRLICPLEITTFGELMKQTDPKSRRATVSVMDRLSRGLCLKTAPERVFEETLALLRLHGPAAASPSVVGEDADVPPDARPAAGTESVSCGVPDSLLAAVWTRVGYITGYVAPGTLAGGSDASALEPAVRAEFLRRPDLVAWAAEQFEAQMWNANLGFMFDVMGDAVAWPRTERDDVVTRINAGNQEHVEEARTLRQTYLAELRGGLEVWTDVFEDAHAAFFEECTGQPPTRAELAASDAGVMTARLIFEALRRRPDMRRYMPSVHLTAELYARARFDRGRPVRPNDLPDISHAVAAVPYCNVFLTEASLASVLSSPSLKVESTYGTRVTGDPAAAVALLSR